MILPLSICLPVFVDEMLDIEKSNLQMKNITLTNHNLSVFKIIQCLTP